MAGRKNTRAPERNERDDAKADGEQSLAFGSFRLLPFRRLLLESGKPVRLGSRALELLIALVDRSGEIVGKDELIALVWPNTFVDEANLRVHIAALRKVLGDGHGGARYVANITGRGYSFIADVRREREPTHESDAALVPERSRYLPAPISRMIGRADVVNTMANAVRKHRHVTIVGVPGIGKTMVALAVAEAVTSVFDDQVRFVDFASISDPALLPSALASVLGLPVVDEDVGRAIVSFLADCRMLIVFDNCEHMIEAAAVLTERVLKGAAGVHILATSREALRTEGEWVHRLAPLAVPPQSAKLSVTDAMTFPAVELFVERASSSEDAFFFRDADVDVVSNICRRLDGIPLAIELVAARVDMFGLRELAAFIDDRFLLRSPGKRTARARQQTLGATLDWSYGILSPLERAVLRRLSVFAGGFTMESAVAVAAPDITANQVFELVASLAAKSLVTVDTSGEEAQYRLLEMTRAYARDKLQSSEESRLVPQRHAEHFRDLMRRAEAEVRTREPPEWLRAFSRKIDDVRAAIDWAFGQDGDARVGIEVTAVSAELFFQLSLTEELKTRIERALSRLAEAGLPDRRCEMQLNVALGVAIFNTHGPTPELTAITGRALEIAEALGPGPHQLQALWGVIRERYIVGAYERSLELIERYGAIAQAQRDAEAGLIHARMRALILHLVGRQAEAREQAERALRLRANPFRLGYENLYQDDHGVIVRSYLTRILWVQGFPEQSLRMSRDALETARSLDNKLLLCTALSLACCPVALWTGDVAVARLYVSELLSASQSGSFRYWNFWGRLYETALGFQHGFSVDVDEGAIANSALQIEMLGTLHPRLAGVQAFARAESGQAGWSQAEMVRLMGERALAQPSPEAAARAETLFARALAIARQQGARSWELRAAMSLAMLWRDAGCRSEAHDLLNESYSWFMEGHATKDLMRARTLLDDMSRLQA